MVALTVSSASSSGLFVPDTARTEDDANSLRREAAALIAADAPVDWLLLAHEIVVSRTGLGGFLSLT
jgi:hypothetical protein